MHELAATLSAVRLKRMRKAALGALVAVHSRGRVRLALAAWAECARHTRSRRAVALRVMVTVRRSACKKVWGAWMSWAAAVRPPGLESLLAPNS